ncbi:MAG TPA: DUF4174 domain-containing protein [Chthoniobacteraceae bacterium]|jgi:hypothetical protein|nr:DUF4174 domain-containing protein [Chthoniobacteraceae bacterium]
MRFACLTSLLLFTLLAADARAAVVRLAPEFTYLAAGNQARSLKSLRGQAVVLIISDSPRRGAFRKQLKYIQEIYQQFASKQVVFIAAVNNNDGTLPSNIPMAVATNGAAVASAYGVQKGFQLVVIGRDGNIDYQTSKVVPPERVRDVIQNSFAVQTGARSGN